MEEVDNSSDEEYEEIQENKNSIDLEQFYKNYEKNKESYVTTPHLNKYEKTKIVSERAQQLATGSISFLKNPENYSNVQEIALEELKQKKIPMIIQRTLPNKIEYWKLEDCIL
jgi:DNA-directed RNA polymerase subunit K/omega